MEPTTAGKIFSAIPAIMQLIEPIKKTRTNTEQGYKFRGVDDAMNTISPLLATAGVFIFTAKTETLSSDAIVSKKGSAGYRIRNRYTFRFCASDGSFIEVVSDGEAIDYGDKASNKAASVAYREAIFKTFCIPFEGNDTENESHDLQPQAPPPARKPAPAPASRPAATTTPLKKFLSGVPRIKDEAGIKAASDWMAHNLKGDDVTAAMNALAARKIEILKDAKQHPLPFEQPPQGE
jgi:hypothetical protein